MKALTLHQPWASLIACGAKTIETRSWSTWYRGPLAIHAGKHVDHGAAFELADALHDAGIDFASWQGTAHHARQGRASGVRGAVVATCTLADVVPIIADDVNLDPWVLQPAGSVVSGHEDDFPDGWLELYHPVLGSPTDPEVYGRSIPEEAHYGDFTPGRFAWLLVDVEPCDPIPAKGRQGLWEYTS